MCRSLIANLSAANCYKSDHLKQPENWSLGTMLPCLLSFQIFASIKPCQCQANKILCLYSGKGKIHLYCWVFPHCVPWIYSTCCCTCSCQQQGITNVVRYLFLVIIFCTFALVTTSIFSGLCDEPFCSIHLWVF